MRALLLGLAAVAGMSSAAQMENGTIKLSVQEQALCLAEGGCEIYSKAYVDLLIRTAIENGKKACRNST